MKKPTASRRPGPRAGIRLSECVWTRADGALDRCYAGTINHLILSAWAKPTTPRDAVPRICAKYLKLAGAGNTLASPRSYIQQRVYELRRRGLLVAGV